MTEEELLEDHRAWLSRFAPASLSSWERLRGQTREAAVGEAVVRRFLVDAGVEVEPIVEGTGRTPDFRCRRNGGEFLVEATTVMMQTGRNHHVPVDDGSGEIEPTNAYGILEAMRSKWEDKARQFDGFERPGVLFIVTSSANLGFERVELALGKTFYSVPIGVDLPAGQATRLELHPFGFVDDDGILQCQSERLSAIVVMHRFRGTRPEAYGLLHPSPLHPFDPIWLTEVEFDHLILEAGDATEPRTRLVAVQPNGHANWAYLLPYHTQSLPEAHSSSDSTTSGT